MPYTCPKCERELKNPKQWHNCVKVSIDSLFEDKPDELVLLFDKLLAEVTSWNDVAVSATQNCVVFVHRQTFLIIRPMKKQLDLKFYSQTEPEEDFITKTVAYHGRFVNHIRLSSLDDLTSAIYKFVRKSYDIL